MVTGCLRVTQCVEVPRYIQSGRLCTLIWTGYQAKLFAGTWLP